MARQQIRRRGDGGDMAAARSALARLGAVPAPASTMPLRGDADALEQLAAVPDPWPLLVAAGVIRKKSRRRSAP